MERLYHITPIKNLNGIIKNGLQKRNSLGICTVSTLEPVILQYIIETMLIEEDENQYAVLEIDLAKHNISSNELMRDSVVEATNEIHRYILRDTIDITADDHIETLNRLPLGFADLYKVEREISELIKTLQT